MLLLGIHLIFYAASVTGELLWRTNQHDLTAASLGGTLYGSMTHPNDTPNPTTPPHPAQRANWRTASAAWLRANGRGMLPLLLTVGLSLLLIWLVPPSLIRDLGNYGYLGVFTLTLLASATLFLPSPALAAAFVAGEALNPWLVGLVSGIGAGLGESTGYFAGRGGSALAHQSRWYPRIERWVQRYGMLTVFGLAAVPSPLIDLAGIAAGTLDMPYPRYLLACSLGKTIRFTLYALLGSMLL